MAKTVEQIKTELGITNETTLTQLLTLAGTYNVFSQAEINNIKSLSVMPLPNKVTNQAEELKARFTNIVLNDNSSAIHSINVRNVIANEILSKLDTLTTQLQTYKADRDNDEQIIVAGKVKADNIEDNDSGIDVHTDGLYIYNTSDLEYHHSSSDKETIEITATNNVLTIQVNETDESEQAKIVMNGNSSEAFKFYTDDYLTLTLDTDQHAIFESDIILKGDLYFDTSYDYGLYKSGNGNFNINIPNDKKLTLNDVEIPNKTYVDTQDNTLQNNISKIIDGTTTVAKATKDANGDTISSTYLKVANIVNALNDTSTNKALSANKGKELKDSLDTLYNYVGFSNADDSDTTINKLREVFAFLTGALDNQTIIDLLNEKQNVIDNSHKLDADLVDDTNATHKFVTASEKAQITTNQNAIAGILDGTNIDSFADVETALDNGKNYANNIYSLATNNIAGKDTSTNILAKSSNTGIWVGTDNNHWYFWNGTQYVDGGVYEATNGIGYANTNSSIDFNAVNTNTIYNILLGSNGVYSNAPSEFSKLENYTLIDITTNTGYANNFRQQTLIGSDCTTFVRTYANSSWSSWNKTNKLSASNIQSSSTPNTFDFNNAPDNTIGNLLFTSLTNVSNYPPNLKSGDTNTLITYTSKGYTYTIKTQIFIDEKGGISKRFYYNNSWQNWSINATPTISDTSNGFDFNNVATNTISNILMSSGTYSNAPSDFNKYREYTLFDFTTNTKTFNSLRRQILNDALGNWYQRNYVEGYGWSDWIKNTQLVFNPTTAQELIDMCALAIQSPNSIVNLTGTYDLSDILTDDITLENGIKLIGSGNSKVIFNYTGSDVTFQDNKSPFRKGYNGGFTMENITIEASRCRYCVHDEDGGYTDVYHNVYKNCNFYLDNTNYGGTIGMQCLGGGLGANGTIEITNCKFHSTTKPNYTGEIYDASYHNSASSIAQSKIFISNCYFEHTFRLGWYGSSTAITRCMINNCSMASAIIHNPENASAVVENTEIIAWNNEIRS